MAEQKTQKKFLHKAHPEQAGVFRRFFAFTVDMFFISLIAFGIYVAYHEIRASRKNEPGIIKRVMDSFEKDRSFIMTTDEEEAERFLKRAYLQILKQNLKEEELQKIKDKSIEELKILYPEHLSQYRFEEDVILMEKWFEILFEFVIAYLYFTFFFSRSGRTPGKKFFGLKVIDLKHRPGLGWYQSFERAHGYTASLLIATLGFLQVLWDKEGLTMHDKIAGTTVIKLPRKKIKKKKSSERIGKTKKKPESMKKK
ncbi:MAG: RDD family protein [Candidatus Aminicenantes bacterium]|nr:RDD family protein [Candidatus Aminicenantes bacterium]